MTKSFRKMERMKSIDFFKNWNERKFDLPNYLSKLKEERKIKAMKVINQIERDKARRV